MNKSISAYKILLITAMLFCATYSSAQKEQESTMPENTATKQKKNALKIDLFRPLTYGEFTIYYERKIKNRLSFEVGAGPSISHFRYFFPIWIGMLYPNEGDPIGGDLGVTVHAGIRYYAVTKTNGMSGLYIGPELRYRLDGLIRFKTGVHSSTESLSFNLGYQTKINKKVAFDFYIGPGVSFTSGVTKYLGLYGMGYYEKYYSDKSFFSFYLNMGVKICVGW